MSSSRLTVFTEDSITDLEEQFGSSLSISGEWIQIPRRAFSSADDNEIITIPRELNSKATLRFLGLSKAATDETWSRYAKFLEQRDDDIFNFAKATVRGGQDTASIDNEDWIIAMRTMGVRKVLRNRIMTPGFESIRLIKTPQAWVLQTFKERWFALESLDNIVLGRRGQKATGFVSLKERKANKAKEKEGKASSSKMKDDEAEDNRLAIETAVQDRSAKSDEVEWFKGGDYECLKKVFVPEDRGGPGYITRRLQSKPPTDFSREFGDTYWAKTLQLAEVYADFHQARNKGDILTGILHIIIPKATVESATQFKETKHWNEYVWLNSIDMIHIPGHLAYLERAQIVVGQVLDIGRDQILRMYRAGESYSVLKARMFASGESATQIACKGKEIHERLDAEGRMWLEEWNRPTALQKRGAE